jgi:hypothetical protein
MSYRLLIIFLASSAEMGKNRLKVLPSTAICDASSLPPSSSYIFWMTVTGTLLGSTCRIESGRIDSLQ